MAHIFSGLRKRILFWRWNTRGLPWVYSIWNTIKKSLFGKTTKTEKEFEDYLCTLDSVYNAENYHIYKNNCNHFTNAICLFLCNKPLDDDIVNQYKTLDGTAFGKWVISRLDAINEQNKAKTIVPDLIEGKKDEEKK